MSERQIALEHYVGLQNRAVYTRIEEERQRLKSFSERLHNLSPVNVLSRGYTVILDKDNRHIFSANQLETGQHIQVMFSDGNLNAVITEDDYAKEKTDI